MKTAILPEVKEANAACLGKGVFLVLLHATRIPPHIGMLFDGSYHSLTIKGKDLDVSLQVLIKNILIRKVPALFLEIKPVLRHSTTEMSEIFKSGLLPLERVDIGKATCFSPVKTFFSAVSSLSLKEVNFLYELIPLLQSAGMTGTTSGFFLEKALENGVFRFPYYTMHEIHAGIQQVRTEFK